MALPWGKVATYLLVTVFVTVGTSVVMVLAQRSRLPVTTSFEGATWHGRPVSQRDREPTGVQIGFPLFLLVYLVLLALGIFVLDALLVGG